MLDFRVLCASTSGDRKVADHRRILTVTVFKLLQDLVNGHSRPAVIINEQTRA